MPTTEAHRADAVAWLVGRLAWERLLTDLQERAEHTGGPVALEPAVDVPTTPAKAA